MFVVSGNRMYRCILVLFCAAKFGVFLTIRPLLLIWYLNVLRYILLSIRLILKSDLKQYVGNGSQWNSVLLNSYTQQISNLNYMYINKTASLYPLTIVSVDYQADRLRKSELNYSFRRHSSVALIDNSYNLSRGVVTLRS